MTREEYARLKNASVGKTLLKAIKDGTEIVVDYQDILDMKDEIAELVQKNKDLTEKNQNQANRIDELIATMRETLNALKEALR